MRKLRSFDVHEEFSSVLTFGMTCWGEKQDRKDKTRLDKNMKKAGGAVVRRQESADTAHH